MSESFAPRYHQIEQSLRARISSLPAHALLPSEAALCEEFSVSRMTVRAAMQRLEADDLVYRQPGRGTFVAEAQPHRQVSRLRGFSAEMRRRGLEPSSRVLTAHVRPATDDERADLRLRARAEVVELRRIRVASGQPIADEHTVLPADMAPVLDADLAGGSLHEQLRALGRTATSGTCNIRAEAADRTTARELGLRTGSPVLVEERLILDQDGVPLERTATRYAADRYALEASFTVEPPAPVRRGRRQPS
ncbi:GntR family transcriptional regulator [Motilibacter peucedani]|uniref:GntR family transcriptional regulator n=1 Tax=Motilibacter peucedani TaxID=598650 RepID=A0A420XQK6_9ACTN|nr:GntR family transcriptional regulator [Motilibacter peucedani]RKS75591.1 GntR family transcriptional regulator [Motilibacter peucedani]